MPHVVSQSMNEPLVQCATVTSGGADETRRWAEAVGRRIDRPVTLSLVGALGAGKSVLAAGLCRGLGVEETVTSPTFILYEEYRGRLPVVHCDFYRLAHDEEIEALGLFERIGEAVVMAEWGDRSPEFQAVADAVVHMEMTGGDGRLLRVESRPALTGLWLGEQ